MTIVISSVSGAITCWKIKTTLAEIDCNCNILQKYWKLVTFYGNGYHNQRDKYLHKSLY